MHSVVATFNGTAIRSPARNKMSRRRRERDAALLRVYEEGEEDLAPHSLPLSLAVNGGNGGGAKREQQVGRSAAPLLRGAGVITHAWGNAAHHRGSLTEGQREGGRTPRPGPGQARLTAGLSQAQVKVVRPLDEKSGAYSC